MGTRSRRSSDFARGLFVAAAAGSLGLSLGAVGGCASDSVSDDQEAYSKTTTKRTVETPTEKRTTTTTHEKDTKVYPPQ